MKNAILIGNGFTSQLIKEYSDSYMKERLLLFFSKEYIYINDLFNRFRTTAYNSKDIYRYDGGLKCSDNLFPSNDLYPQSDRIFYNDKLRNYIIKVLDDTGFKDTKGIYESYFINYGLIFEVIRNEITSIENLLKVTNMFKDINKIDHAMEDKIKQIAKEIYYNNGKYGLEDTNLLDYSKIKAFFMDFDFVFTTNYDLILDDICENQDKVFHLHGGFNIEHRNLKSNKRLNEEQSYIVWGINGDEKYKELSPGFDWSKFRWDAFRWGPSLLADYFSHLENKEYEVIHIFGFSGENDQHINKKIIANKYLRKIVFYCNPNKIGDYNSECKIRDLFHGTNKIIIFEPWTSIWNRIK